MSDPPPLPLTGACGGAVRHSTEMDHLEVGKGLDGRLIVLHQIYFRNLVPDRSNACTYAADTCLAPLSLKIDRDDGRVQYPIIPIFFSPESCADRSRMLYSSQTSNVAQSFEVFSTSTRPHARIPSPPETLTAVSFLSWVPLGHPPRHPPVSVPPRAP
jgi:hypothetical protein